MLYISPLLLVCYWLNYGRSATTMRRQRIIVMSKKICFDVKILHTACLAIMKVRIAKDLDLLVLNKLNTDPQVRGNIHHGGFVAYHLLVSYTKEESNAK